MKSIFSSEVKCKMKFAIYLPPKAESSKCPVLYWLSGDYINSLIVSDSEYTLVSKSLDSFEILFHDPVKT